MIWLRQKDIEFLHAELVARYGGDTGLRDEALLQSALAAATATFEGADLFPGVVSKAVRLGFGLVANHPFVDGNKRVGAHAMLVVLGLNGIELCCTSKELEQTFWDVAAGKMTFDDLLCWVQAHIDGANSVKK